MDAFLFQVYSFQLLVVAETLFCNWIKLNIKLIAIHTKCALDTKSSSF